MLALLTLAGCGQGSSASTPAPTGPAPRDSPAVQRSLKETPRQEEALCISTGGTRAECELNRTNTEIEDAERKPR